MIFSQYDKLCHFGKKTKKQQQLLFALCVLPQIMQFVAKRWAITFLNDKKYP